jgi:DTW domain-containing protein YfiP
MLACLCKEEKSIPEFVPFVRIIHSSEFKKESYTVYLAHGKKISTINL